MQRSGLSCTLCLHTRTWDKKAKAEICGALIFASDIIHRKLFLQFLRGCRSRPAGRDPLEDAVLWAFFCTLGFTPGHEIRPQKAEIRASLIFVSDIIHRKLCLHSSLKTVVVLLEERSFGECRVVSCTLGFTPGMRLEAKSWDRIRVTSIFDSGSRGRWADHLEKSEITEQLIDMEQDYLVQGAKVCWHKTELRQDTENWDGYRGRCASTHHEECERGCASAFSFLWTSLN